MIAAEYVLGTLTAGARRRFETMINSDAKIRATVDQWQQRLNVLGAGLTPVPVPKNIYPKIKARLGFLSESENLRQTNLTTKPKGLLALWRNSAIMATLVSLVLASVLVLTLTTTQPIKKGAVDDLGQTLISIVNNTKNQAAWVIRSDITQGKINIKAITTQAIAPRKSFELWLIASNSKTPISLGLISNQGTTQLILKPSIRKNFKHAKALAISLEPAGGSTTGLPSGPILYQGLVHKL